MKRRKNLQFQKEYILLLASIACMLFFFPFIKKTIFKKHFHFDNKQQKYITSYFFAWSVQYVILGIIFLLSILNKIFWIDIFYYLEVFSILFLVFWTIFWITLIWLHKPFFIWQYVSQYNPVKNIFLKVFFAKVKWKVKLWLDDEIRIMN